MSLPSSSSSIRAKRDDRCQIFLSFRGGDTRNFTDHLYDSLKKRGLVTLINDPKLERGEGIASELFKAIQQSMCSVVVLSENYASSSWCLEELAQIVKQKEEQGLKVFPVYCHVDPSDLRRQEGKVGEAFAKHEERYKEDKIQKWRNALTEVASISGWNLNAKHESEIIEDIVKQISAKLWQTYDELVGIDSCLTELYRKIDIWEDGVRIIGICGMAGIGKSTLARVVYGQLSPLFEGKSFIADVRQVSDQYGLVSLQKQLLYDILNEVGFHFSTLEEGIGVIRHRLPQRKVLIVLDDVSNTKQLEYLVGSRDWFGSGSRIVVTTRDESLLLSHRVDEVYKVEKLNDDDAHRLLLLKAFSSDTKPTDEFMELSRRSVSYAGGLPLALEVLGSYLRDRDAAGWKRTIKMLEIDSKKGILDRLKIISFDELEESEKNIFLNIACFFEGKEKDSVIKALNACGFSADIGIDVLVAKSLATVDEDNRLRMHDVLKEMGRKIAEENFIKDTGKGCRYTATEVNEGVVIDYKRSNWKELVSLPLPGPPLLTLESLRFDGCVPLQEIPKIAEQTFEVESSRSPLVSPCIFRTPFPRLQLQDPQLASIGPYHKTEDLPLEKYKNGFLGRFISRTKKQGKDLCFYLEKMMSIEGRIRECYSEDLEMSSSDFVEMMLLDGCFIMEALACFAQDGVSKDWAFPIQPWHLRILVLDLLILENQIPFFVLEMLFESLKESQSQEEMPTLSLPTMALKFFNLAFPRSIDISCEFDHLEPDHLLDLFLHSIYPSSRIHSDRKRMVLPNFVHSFLKKINARNQSSVSTEDQQYDPPLPFYLTKNAMELQSSGIELRPRIAARFTDIDFRNGVLEIPSVSVDDLFIAILNNGVAFEHFSKRRSKHLSAYVSFMSKLIRHPTDAELLSSNGIISSFSHNDQKVFNAFHMLGQQDIEEFQISYLPERLKELKCYYTRYGRTRPWQRLVSRYWNVSFFCVANLLFGFILLKWVVGWMIYIGQEVKLNGMHADLRLINTMALFSLGVILVIILLRYNRHTVPTHCSDVANASESAIASNLPEGRWVKEGKPVVLKGCNMGEHA